MEAPDMRAAAAMLRDLKELLMRADLLALTVAFLLAWGTITFIKALVGSLILPAIAALLDEPHIVFLSFSIGITEFHYGAFIQATIVFGLIAATILLLSVLHVAHQERLGISAEPRACPECASTISMVAKRCPHCTAPVPPS
jgi:large conductance mechanosensitive channel